MGGEERVLNGFGVGVGKRVQASTIPYSPYTHTHFKKDKRNNQLWCILLYVEVQPIPPNKILTEKFI